MELFLVRHGQSEGNVDKSKYFEKLDCQIELTNQGIEDAKNAARKILELQEHISFFGSVYYSPYIRAIQTKEVLISEMKKSNGTLVYFDNIKESVLLREREWGGLRDIVESGMKSENHFNFFYRPLNGESFADCYNRVVLFDQWIQTDSTSDKNIIVAHGEFIKLYLMHKLGWTVQEFDKWKSPRNGEVLYLKDGELSILTPLRERKVNDEF